MKTNGVTFALVASYCSPKASNNDVSARRRTGEDI
jgi:hypothetical protein